MSKQIIGFVDTRWKPPRKSKLELQIEREDAVHWASRQEPVADFYYTPTKLHLSETAKHVFAAGVHYIKLLRL